MNVYINARKNPNAFIVFSCQRRTANRIMELLFESDSVEDTWEAQDIQEALHELDKRG